MDANEFVAIVEFLAIENAASSAVQNLLWSPDSRSEELHNMSEWFLGLDPIKQLLIKNIALLSAAHSLTTFLSILDGAKSIEDDPEKGRLELYYVKGSERTLLNDQDAEPLNDKVRFSI